ncbi:PH domain-containing protein [Candidatus Daviesbacteria bacterium]|nr:PH domain-containing protein [Candidatus Daviesbacteria bacterium]MBI4038466.1 PH domain-containing protein [Candidatus Daviesbacteria bacterium]
MAKFHYRESPTAKQTNAFKKYLSEDEELVLVTSFSEAYIRSKVVLYLLFPGFLFFGLGLGLGWFLGLSKIWALVLAIVGMMLAAILKTMHLYHGNRYLLTTRRVIIKKGIFGVKLTATLFDKITHLEVDQSIIDRLLLHHGSIIINTAGMNKGEINLHFVDYPMELKNLLERLINREREQFGLRGATLTEVEGEIIS